MNLEQPSSGSLGCRFMFGSPQQLLLQIPRLAPSVVWNDERRDWIAQEIFFAYLNSRSQCPSSASYWRLRRL